MDIPKLLHQIWWQGISELPARYVDWHAKWAALHPGWRHITWDEQQVLQLLSEHYPQYLKLFQSYKRMIQRIDLSRIFILHHFGGVYADMDTEPLKPIDSLLSDGTRLFFTDPTSWLLDERPLGLNVGPFLHKKMTPVLNNDFMGSTAGHPFWRLVMERLVPDKKKSPFVPEIMHVCNSTGPGFLGKVFRHSEWKDDPSTQLIPVDLVSPGIKKRWLAKWFTPGQPLHIDLSKAYLVSHYDNTWMPKNTGTTLRAIIILLLIVCLFFIIASRVKRE